MSIDLNNKIGTIYRGTNYKPVNYYLGSKKAAGWKEVEQTGKILEWNNTYNDNVLSAKIKGNGTRVQTNRSTNIFDMSVSSLYNVNNKCLVATSYAQHTSKKLKDFCKTLKVGDTVILSGTYAPTRPYIYLGTPALLQWNINVSKTITDDMLNSYVYIYTSTSVDPVPANIFIQIEYGTTATSYTQFVPNSPSLEYPSYPTFVENPKLSFTGRNFFDIEKALLSNATRNGNSITFTGNGNIDILLPAGHYTISFKKDGIMGNIFLRNGKVSSGYIAQIDGTQQYFGYTASVDGYLRISSFTNGLTLSNIQIENGSIVHNYRKYYTPYINTFPYILRGFPNGTQEEYDVVNGSIPRLMSIRALTGAEDFIYNPTINGYYLVDYNIKNSALSFCSHCPVGSSLTAINYRCVQIIMRFYGWAANFPTLEDFKAYLASEYAAGHPVTVYNELITPVVENVTPISLPTFPTYTRAECDADMTAKVRVADI